jgi:hypothetical protein
VQCPTQHLFGLGLFGLILKTSRNFDVSLTVHHSINLFYHQLDAQLLYSVIYILQNKATVHQVSDKNKLKKLVPKKLAFS